MTKTNTNESIKLQGTTQFSGLTILDPNECSYEVIYKMKDKHSGETKEGTQIIKSSEGEETVRAVMTNYLIGFKSGKDIQLWIGQVYL